MGALEILTSTLKTSSLMITGLSFTMLLDVFTYHSVLRSFISSVKAPNCTSTATSLFDFSSSSWLIHRVISGVLDSSFFLLEVHLIHCRNFSNQATARTRVIQLEDRDSVVLSGQPWSERVPSSCQAFLLPTVHTCGPNMGSQISTRRMGLSANAHS